MGDHRMSPEAEQHVLRKIWDIPYCDNSPSQVLDIWYPNKESAEPYPVIVHIHGGGFVEGGHREDSMEPMLRGTDRGYAVVSIEYRKAREARFPAMLYDAKAAVRFLKANAVKYHLDSGRIALWGPSAGGWIAAMTALTPGNTALEDLSMGNASYDSSVAALIDWCGPCGGFLDMDKAYGTNGITPAEKHDIPESGESLFLGRRISEVPELVRMASPYIYVHKDMPPVMIVHGTNDPVVPFSQSVIFADAIRKTAGADRVYFYMAGGVGHHGRIWWHEDWVADMCFDFLDRVMGHA